jgi:hypothetical protein
VAADSPNVPRGSPCIVQLYCWSARATNPASRRRSASMRSAWRSTRRRVQCAGAEHADDGGYEPPEFDHQGDHDQHGQELHAGSLTPAAYTAPLLLGVFRQPVELV